MLWVARRCSKSPSTVSTAQKYPSHRVTAFRAIGVLRLLPLDEGDEGRIQELMTKYRHVPMDLADAALVRPNHAFGQGPIESSTFK
jgi:hypothetical protein